MNKEVAEAKSKIRVLKTTSCASTSGKTGLTYQVGCSQDFRVHFRISGNTGAGSYSKEWVSLDAVWEAFTAVPSDKAFTSYALHRLYKGTSANTPAFLLAALLSEGLVRSSTTKPRCYERADDALFLAEVAVLMNRKGEGGEEGAPEGHMVAPDAIVKRPSRKGTVTKRLKVAAKAKPAVKAKRR